MKLPLLAAALCAVLAAPSSAAVNDTPKFDFTKKPELMPVPALPERPAHKEMPNKDAKVLQDHLFALYQNIGNLSRFIHYKRAEDEPSMPAEDLAWAQKELAAAKAAADIAQPKAQTALKVGIEREAPWPESIRKEMAKLSLKSLGRPFRSRLKYLQPAGGGKPPLEHWQMVENEALSAVMRDLYYLVQSARARSEEADAEAEARDRKELETDLAELAESRRAIEAATKAAEGNRLRDGGRLEDARKKVNRASAGDFGGQNEPGNSVSRVNGGSRIDPAEAARRANEVPRHQPIKSKSITVPSP